MATREEIIDALEARAQDMDIDIVDVELTGSDKPILSVRIDHADEAADTISLDEVAAQAWWINEVLDELDPIVSSYTLEVSSPGMARPLRKAHDFERFAGQTVKLTTFAGEGRKNYTAKLLGLKGDSVCIEVDGEPLEIELSQIKKCTIKPDYAI